MRASVLVVTGLLLVVATSGCFDPFRVRVAAGALEASPLDWNVTHLPQQGGLGSKNVETRYHHEGGNDPPFQGVLQVFSIRDNGLRNKNALFELAMEVVDRSLREQGIAVDSNQDEAGERRIASGISTRWFSHEGRIETAPEGPDVLFDEGAIDVRILAEVGYDGKDKTGFIAIAYVQVGRDGTVPLAPAVRDEQTWIEVVGDPSGSIGGASLPSERGLLYNLRTHG